MITNIMHRKLKSDGEFEVVERLKVVEVIDKYGFIFANSSCHQMEHTVDVLKNHDGDLDVFCGECGIKNDVQIRPSLDDWGLMLAATASTRADCTRRKVGAIVFDRTGRPCAIGYNGAPGGLPGCLTDGACPRGQFSHDQIPPGGSYENCIAVHAEANALLFAARNDLIGGTIYITDEPCSDCDKLIRGAGVRRIVWPKGERSYE